MHLTHDEVSVEQFIVILFLHSLGWQDVSPKSSSMDTLILSRIECTAGVAEITYNVMVGSDFSWQVSLRGHNLSSIPALECLPPAITSLADAEEILSLLNSSSVCIGNPDEKYSAVASTRKGVFMNPRGTCV